MCGDFADEFWREAREGAGVCSATALRRALPADLAEIVRCCSRILAGKVSGARLNDSLCSFKKRKRGRVEIKELPRLRFALTRNVQIQNAQARRTR